MKGIIFQPDLVGYLLREGRIQTRRVIKPQPDHFHVFADRVWRPQLGDDEIPYPHKVGDMLYVKERHTYVDIVRSLYDSDLVVVDYADDDRRHCPVEEWVADEVSNWIADREVDGDGDNWRSPRFMPQWASRAIVEIVRVDVRRVRDMTEEDAAACGMEIGPVVYNSAGGLNSARGRATLEGHKF